MAFFFEPLPPLPPIRNSAMRLWVRRWYWRLKFWWDFSRLKFYACLIVHRKIRTLPGGIIESACEKCFDQSKWGKETE